MPLFSVIIPVYNRSQLLVAAIRSVLEQEWQDFELILVDDGSSEDIAAAVAPYRDRLRLVRQRNAGPGSARNRGIELAQGRYVAFLDSDDLWFPWTLSLYAEAIRTEPEPAFVAGRAREVVAVEELAAVSRVASRLRRFDDYLATAPCGVWIGTCGAAIRRDQLAEVGGFVTRRMNAEDSDLWLRLGTAAGFVHIETPPVFAYRRHVQSAVADQRRSYVGIRHLLGQERRGGYPGGPARQHQRQRIVTRHARPVSLRCLREERLGQGWRLYRATFVWHLEERRLRYLAAFPLLVAWHYLRRYVSNRTLGEVLQ